jgi:competence protein ComEA
MAAHRKKHKNIRSSWKDYFSLNNRVRRGLMVLFSLIFIEIVVLIYLHYLPSSTVNIDMEKFKKEIDAFYSQLDDTANVISESSYAEEAGFSFSIENKKEIRGRPEVFWFNPNHLTADDWKRLGFSEKQIRSIQNYESKGGTFRSKDDLKKMYAIREEEFRRIEPFIVIPDPKKAYRHDTYETKTRPVVRLDIGTADSVELEKLPMVGTYLAQKIYNYRDKLGGFYSITQLKEVRGLRDSVFQILLPRLVLKDSTNLRRMNLNTVDYSELNKHPYIDNTIANVIISYRKQHGAFNEVDDLRKVALVDAELYRKIAPYLKVE